MITAEEFVKSPLPKDNAVWLHCLDVVEHCLKGDVRQTKWGNPNPSWDLFKEWARDMQNRRDWDGNFQQIVDNAYIPSKRWVTEISDNGDLNVDLYLDQINVSNPQCFEQQVKRAKDKPAVTILYSANVNWGQRDDTFMIERHRQCYDIAAQCEAERRPCRVIAVENSQLEEIRGDTLKSFIIIKDYNDPIFPAIWGTFVDNRATNSFLNVMADFLTGTHSFGNGRSVPLRGVRRFFPEDEELVIFGNDIKE